MVNHRQDFFYSILPLSIPDREVKSLPALLSNVKPARLYLALAKHIRKTLAPIPPEAGLHTKRESRCYDRDKIRPPPPEYIGILILTWLIIVRIFFTSFYLFPFRTEKLNPCLSCFRMLNRLAYTLLWQSISGRH